MLVYIKISNQWQCFSTISPRWRLFVPRWTSRRTMQPGRQRMLAFIYESLFSHLSQYPRLLLLHLSTAYETWTKSPQMHLSSNQKLNMNLNPRPSPIFKWICLTPAIHISLNLISIILCKSALSRQMSYLSKNCQTKALHILMIRPLCQNDLFVRLFLLSFVLSKCTRLYAFPPVPFCTDFDAASSVNCHLLSSVIVLFCSIQHRFLFLPLSW